MVVPRHFPWADRLVSPPRWDVSPAQSNTAVDVFCRRQSIIEPCDRTVLREMTRRFVGSLDAVSCPCTVHINLHALPGVVTVGVTISNVTLTWYYYFFIVFVSLHTYNSVRYLLCTTTVKKEILLLLSIKRVHKVTPRFVVHRWESRRNKSVVFFYYKTRSRCDANGRGYSPW